MYNVSNRVYAMLLVEQADAFDVKIEARTADACELILEMGATKSVNTHNENQIQLEKKVSNLEGRV